MSDDTHWTVLTLGNTADEADVRRMCANTLKGPYIIRWAKREVAVIFHWDIDQVLASWDVADRRIAEFFHDERDTHYAAAVVRRHRAARTSRPS